MRKKPICFQRVLRARNTPLLNFSASIFALSLLITLPGCTGRKAADTAKNEAATEQTESVSEIPLVATKFRYLAREHEKHPVFPVKADKDLLISQTAPVMELSDEMIATLLPTRSGIYFVSCPTPDCGNMLGFGSRFEWSPEKPDKIICKYCRKEFPSESCPETGKIKVTAPSGKVIEYGYYQNKRGKKYFFSAGVEYRKAAYFSEMALRLGKLYHLTNDEKYARKAALILCGIARRFPDFVYKFDFPYY